ncbi:MAG: avidin/streptavidin family protein [Pseudomonadaceae bacterium]|nr:avidin/streptavidin family protein [Pseudomonadaceae bacterium]
MSEPAQMLIDGEWVNQNGSTVELREHNGVLSGHYLSRKGRSAAGKKYPLSGIRNGAVLAFHVNWLDEQANLESITSFSGRVVLDASNEATIHTLWTLVRRWEDEAQTKNTGAWNAFLTNADVFTRM